MVESHDWVVKVQLQFVVEVDCHNSVFNSSYMYVYVVSFHILDVVKILNSLSIISITLDL